MGLNSTPSANRIHIGFFGCRNAGKSSLVNALTKQEVSVVSSVKGTTTDPVRKSMELLPLGPVELIDTPGFDDIGELGDKRVQTTRRILSNCDIAVIVIDVNVGMQDSDQQLIDTVKQMNTPYLVVYNKCETIQLDGICVSAKENIGIEELKEKLGHTLENRIERPLIGDLVEENDIVILVVPIDESAPKGRLILPQQQVIRDLLDHHATSLVCQDTELEAMLKVVRPKLVVTDSQRFKTVSQIVPKDIYLTSFSILMARYKGTLELSVEACRKLDTLENGAHILISEGCSHHRQCGDIGTVKLPKWIENYTHKTFEYTFSSGRDFFDDLSAFDLIIHCGGCMLHEKEMQRRLKLAQAQNKPMTNYGTIIAYMNGILERSIEILNFIGN